MSASNTSKRRSRSKSLTYILEIFLCLITVCAITVLLFLLVKYYQLQERANDLQAQVDIYTDPEDPYMSSREADTLIASAYENAYTDGKLEGENELLAEIKRELIESDSALETIKKIYPDELIVVDKEDVVFFPISDSLRHHPFADRDFVVSDSGRIDYTGSAVTDTETWIDVSKFQDRINWEKVASDDIDAAIIRLGYRGYSKGDIMEDETFEYNIEEATANGIKVGVYFLTQATSDSEAVEEAEYILDLIEDYDVECPIVLDVELVGGDDGRGNALSIEERTGYAITFLETIEAAGYDTCIYGNLKTFLLMLDMERLEGYSKWFAGYTDVPYFPYEMDMWQYTEKGSVSGISGNVDLNLRFIR